MKYDVEIEITVSGIGKHTIQRTVDAPDITSAIALGCSDIVLMKVLSVALVVDGTPATIPIAVDPIAEVGTVEATRIG